MTSQYDLFFVLMWSRVGILEKAPITFSIIIFSLDTTLATLLHTMVQEGASH